MAGLPIWADLIFRALQGIQDMMSALTFMQFIWEEAIQASMLGAFLAMRMNNNRGAVLGLNAAQVAVDHLRIVNTEMGMFAPYSKYCFEDFILATDTNIEIYRDILLIKGKSKQ
jgi:hypothetical protein